MIVDGYARQDFDLFEAYQLKGGYERMPVLETGIKKESGWSGGGVKKNKTLTNVSQPKFPHNLFFVLFGFCSIFVWYPFRSMSRMWAEFWLLRVLCCDVFLLSFGLCVAFLVLLQTLHDCTQPFHAVSSLCTTPPPSPPLLKKRGFDFQGVVTSHDFNEWILDPLLRHLRPCNPTRSNRRPLLCDPSLLCVQHRVSLLTAKVDRRTCDPINNTRPSAMRNPRGPNYHSSGQMKLLDKFKSLKWEIIRWRQGLKPQIFCI